MSAVGRIGEEHRIGERDRLKGLCVFVCVVCVSYKGRGGVAFKGRVAFKGSKTCNENR